jgi:hypothetical protein
LSTSVSRDGDPFQAVTIDPIFLRNQLILPAGTGVRGVVQRVYQAKRFNLIRGQAAMVLTFKALQVGDHEVPIQMSILSIERNSQDDSRRRDLTTEEGAIIQEKPDIKGDLETAALGTSGGTLAGAIFSHVVRGFAIGMAGGAAYVLVRKGKDVQLPAQTTFALRIDTSVQLPVFRTRTAAYVSPQLQ